MPGVKVLLAPRHSLGGQTIQVEIKVVKTVITGFRSQMSTFKETPAMKAMGLEVAACGIHTDCREIYDSALRVKKNVDIGVLSHDPIFMNIEKIG